jgi:pimeloyl-ACP methyl ester carboxylesterase
LLYLHGRDDGCLTARFAEVAGAHLPPDATTEVVDASGHFLHLEQPDRVAELVLRFLR